MKRYFILIILLTNFCFGQTESRRTFVLTLNVPDNQINSNESFRKIVTENEIKRITCFRENQISTDLYFDKSGNVMLEIDNKNKMIGKSEFEYDDKNRLTKISFFTKNGEFKYGYNYKYNGSYKTEYEIGDSIPKRRTIKLKEENITVYSDYNSEKLWKLNNIVIKNSDNSYDRELRYNDEGLYQEFKYYSNPLEQKEWTKSISYHKGIKISEKDRSLYKTDKNGNRIERHSAYSTDTLKLISTHKFNDRNQVIENDYPTILENFEYDQDGIILKKTIKDRNGITTLNFYYENLLPKKVEKVNKENKVTFKYEYEYFE